jgi:phenylpyruvate tautomerase PptA (4-oxalocrotonate tautomerase family)
MTRGCRPSTTRVLSSDEREQLAEGLINAGVEIKGEGFRSETEVLIAEVPVGNWYESGVRIVPEVRR